MCILPVLLAHWVGRNELDIRTNTKVCVRKADRSTPSLGVTFWSPSRRPFVLLCYCSGMPASHTRSGLGFLSSHCAEAMYCNSSSLCRCTAMTYIVPQSGRLTLLPEMAADHPGIETVPSLYSQYGKLIRSRVSPLLHLSSANCEAAIL